MQIDKTKALNKEYVLVNIIEEIVKKKVKEAMKQADMCQCALCEFNVCALALNALPPRYVTTQKGHMLAQSALMNPEYQQVCDQEIAKAINKVRENMRH